MCSVAYVRYHYIILHLIPFAVLKLDADNFKEEGLLDKIRKDRGYTYEDQITITKTMDNYLGMVSLCNSLC